jgi:hypothetical protein
MCYCRLWLAALHFNENTQRDQPVTQEGKARHRLTALTTDRRLTTFCEIDHRTLSLHGR